MNDSMFANLAEEFISRIRNGQAPDPEKYANLYPQFAERIRETFPTLLLLENAVAGKIPYPNQQAGLPPGTMFGPYRILREIGRGGMGIVYEAIQITTQTIVALKILPSQMPVDTKRLERFIREASITASLHHPNIIPILDVGRIDQTAYFAMKYIEGSGLDRILRLMQQPGSVQNTHNQIIGDQLYRISPKGVEIADGSDPVADAANRIRAGAPALFEDYLKWVSRLGIQAASALAFAHRHKLIHRDIKPSNLILDKRGTLWIADFGLARKIGDPTLTATGILLGTPRYMSPEQAETATGRIDHRSDIYSLGVTLYELLTCRPVFEGETLQQILMQILSRDPVTPCRLNRSIPSDLETVVLKAMAKQREDRYQSAEDLAGDLKCWLQKKPVMARRKQAASRSLQWLRHNYKLAAIVLPLILVSIVFGSLYYREKTREASTVQISNIPASESEGNAGVVAENDGDISPKNVVSSRPSDAGNEILTGGRNQTRSDSKPAETHDQHPSAEIRKSSIDLKQPESESLNFHNITINGAAGTSVSLPIASSAVAGNVYTRTRIRIGTAAPKDSLWHEMLKLLIQEWETISDGSIRVQIYEGGKLGDEKEMVGMVRLGRIQAVAISTAGMAQIDNALACLQIPFMIRSYEELDYVLENIGLSLEKKLEERGLKLLLWSDAGWVRTFSRVPVRTPGDLRNMKLFTSAGDPDTETLYEDLGFHVIPMSLSDMIPSLQAGMINAVNLPPYYVSMTGAHRRVPNMTGIRWNPLVAGIVIDLKTWNQIPEKYRAQMLEAARRAGDSYRDRIRNSGEDSIKVMQERGLKIIKLTDSEIDAWQREAEKAYPLIRGRFTPVEYFDEVVSLLNEYRKSFQ